MNKYDFWNMLTLESKCLVEHYFDDYIENVDFLDIVFNEYKKASEINGLSINDYVSLTNPNKFVAVYYEF